MATDVHILTVHLLICLHSQIQRLLAQTLFASSAHSRRVISLFDELREKKENMHYCNSEEKNDSTPCKTEKDNEEEHDSTQCNSEENDSTQCNSEEKNDSTPCNTEKNNSEEKETNIELSKVTMEAPMVELMEAAMRKQEAMIDGFAGQMRGRAAEAMSEHKEVIAELNERMVKIEAVVWKLSHTNHAEEGHTRCRSFPGLDAEALKLQGNDHYRKKQFEEAVDKYNMAIAKDPDELTLWNNRAAAWIEMGPASWDRAIKSLQEATDDVEGMNKRKPGGANDRKVARAYARLAAIYDKKGEPGLAGVYHKFKREFEELAEQEVRTET